jgi:hypothetical protein
VRVLRSRAAGPDGEVTSCPGGHGGTSRAGVILMRPRRVAQEALRVPAALGPGSAICRARDPVTGRARPAAVLAVEAGHG